jgi:branched-chain amino acid transport system permease protein
MSFWLVQTLNGVTFSMVLFLITAGLTLIFGLMRIINLAQGCFYLLGVLIGFSVVQSTNSFLLCLFFGIVAIGILGIIMQRFFLYRFQDDHEGQVLLTLGFVFILSDLALLIWGGEPKLLPKPPLFEGSVEIGTNFFAIYRLIMILTGVLIAIGLWLFIGRTKMGALIRAGADDIEMARGLGIRIPLLFTAVFGLGAALSSFGGIMAGPLIGAHPGLEWDILLLSMAVVLIGGLGSLKGAFLGSLLVGLVDNFCKVLMPELGLFVIFGAVAIVLAFKPTGLFGKL